MNRLAKMQDRLDIVFPPKTKRMEDNRMLLDTIHQYRSRDGEVGDRMRKKFLDASIEHAENVHEATEELHNN